LICGGSRSLVLPLSFTTISGWTVTGIYKADTPAHLAVYLPFLYEYYEVRSYKPQKCTVREYRPGTRSRVGGVHND
jgi:hypothetical protein